MENPTGKPAIFTEFGAGALAGHHGTKDDIWTEEFQVDVIEGNLEMMSKLDWVAGTSPWILKDFRSPKRVLPGIQDGFNRKGLVSERGVRKAAFETMRQFYEGPLSRRRPDPIGGCGWRVRVRYSGPCPPRSSRAGGWWGK